MDLTCYVRPGWEPRIRPASPKRDWMDATSDSFAYRCLPLNIANAHGWEILSPCGFDARWDGGDHPEAVEIRLDPDTPPHRAPVALFGHGTITFHIDGVFRTPEGWNLWAGGPPNRAKDGIAPLGGVIETDWSPYTFTMNWRFTRPGQWVRFEENEPFCFIFPVERGLVESVAPQLRPMAEEPELEAQFEAWSASRNAFHQRMRDDPPAQPSQTWQKFYYRGTRPDGSAGAPDHQSKLRVAPFRTPEGEPLVTHAAKGCPMHRAATPPRDPDALALQRRQWLAETHERQRALSPRARSIHRWEGLGGEAFLDHYYAPARPVLLSGEMADWPALSRWSPGWLREMLGGTEVAFQGGRAGNPGYEIEKRDHLRRMPFDAWIDSVVAAPGNDSYVTAFNSADNRAAFAPLAEEMGFPGKFLTRDAEFPDGMLWIGPAGTFTPLHHDLTNNLLAQVVGRKQLILAPPSETPRLYNRHEVYSDVHDIAPGRFDSARFPLARDARLFHVTLEPGEMLFLPIGWWHQVTALDFSVSVTYTNFRWPNGGGIEFPL